MTRLIRRPNKRDLFVVGTAAALAFAPQAMAAEGTGGDASVETLRKENARLHNQLAEMQKKLDRMKEGRKSRKNPIAVKELDSGYSNGGGGKTSASMTCGANMKTSAGMTCGANMNMNGASKPQDASGKTSAEMTCGANMQFKMPEGSQFLYNPVFGGTDNMYHVHPEGMWMFNTRVMHMEMDGLQAGTTPIAASQVGPAVFPGSPFPNVKYPYMMIPTKMSMDMAMSMMMYGVTDRLTVMAMMNYKATNMNMFMDMGNQPSNSDMDMDNPSSSTLHNVLNYTSPMATAGVGDTEVDAMYKLYDDRKLGKLVGTLGLSLPTGSTMQTITMMGYTFRAPYDMQLGSGTVDLKPALTYNWISDDVRWNLGATVSGIIHTNTSNGWAFGDSAKLSAWVQHDFKDDFKDFTQLFPVVAWYRMTFTDTGRIRGQDPQISCLNTNCFGSIYSESPMPDADPHNYGGQIISAFVGAYYRYNSFNIGLEGGVPLYQNLNGLQMKNSWQLTGAVQSMF
jgi:hypothetical protein